MSDVLNTVVTDAVAAVPTVVEVVGDVQTVSDSTQTLAARVEAAEKALASIISFINVSVVPGLHASVVKQPLLTVPTAPSA